MESQETTQGLPAAATDALFNDPYIDVDEWRAYPVRHRYVHGGFRGTDTRFSVYFPPTELYEGRFFQHITPVPESENLAQKAVGQADKIGFSIASGAYFLETNGGGADYGVPGRSTDPTIAAYRANAASAQYSRVIARQIFGEHRPFGYAYGGSGGGYRTIGGAENTSGVWDGFVPYVIGSPVAVPNVFSVRMHAQRVLRGAFEQIIDASEPGSGPGAMEGLTADQRAALQEVTQMGFPLRSWFGWKTMGTQAFSVIYPRVASLDPGYFDDFWTEAGYLGADPTSSVHADRVTLISTIAEIVTRSQAHRSGLIEDLSDHGTRGGVDQSFKGPEPEEDPVAALRFDALPVIDVMGAEVIARAGAAAGSRFSIKHLTSETAILDIGNDMKAASRLRVGDEVTIDNSNFLAAQTYHRHQVPPSGFPVWDQFRHDDGSPVFPQRPSLLGPMFAAAAAGTVQSGRISGKMIVVGSLLDREAYPWQSDWYRSQVQEHFGTAIDERFRLWYVDNALHADDEVQEHPTHSVSYLGVVQHALRAVAAWVERGEEPAATTSYTVFGGQIVLPATAGERQGVQPAVTVTVNGSTRAVVGAGEPFRLVAEAEVPPGASKIVELRWDVPGDGLFAIQSHVAPGRYVRATLDQTFMSSGTFFVTVRAAAQAGGDPASHFERIHNLARVRVIVE